MTLLQELNNMPFAFNFSLLYVKKSVTINSFFGNIITICYKCNIYFGLIQMIEYISLLFSS